MSGEVAFVGAGPGDPRHLTLEAVRVLAAADVVAHDDGVHPEVLAHAPEGAHREAVPDAGPGTEAPEVRGRRLGARAAAGARVVRLVRGDALLFRPTAREVREAARAGARVRVVPGVPVEVAAAAQAGALLTRPGDASPCVALVRVEAGREALFPWEGLGRADVIAGEVDTSTLAEVSRSLVFAGRPRHAPCLVVRSAGEASQRSIATTLGGLESLRLADVRVLLLVGEVATEPALDWTKALPLAGRRVVVTRTEAQGRALEAALRERGADPVLVPTIEILPPSDPSPLVDAVERLATYGWVVLTSPNGVERLFAELGRQGRDARAFGAAQVAAVGPGTARALAEAGVRADLVATERRGEGLAKDLLDAVGEARPRVLLVRAEVAREVLPETLRAAGCVVDVVAAYQTRPPSRSLRAGVEALLGAGAVDAVTFSSGSAVANFCDALEGRAGEVLDHAVVASLGPVTTDAARARGVRVDVTAAEPTVERLVSALEAHFAANPRGASTD